MRRSDPLSNLSSAFHIDELDQLEEEISGNREQAILAVTGGLLRGFHKSSVPDAILVRIAFCFYTFLFDPRWLRVAKVVRRRHLKWKEAVDRIEDPKEEVRRLAAGERDRSHNRGDLRPSDVVKDIDRLPPGAATTVVSILLPEHKRYREAAKRGGQRFGLTESQVRSYIERDTLPYWPTVSVRVEPLEIPTLRIDKSWAVLALGQCLHRLRVGEAARTPKRHPQSQMALLSTGSTIAPSDIGIGVASDMRR